MPRPRHGVTKDMRWSLSLRNRSSSARSQTRVSPPGRRHGALARHEIASEAAWADKVRDANTGGARPKTRQWHFADSKIKSPDLDVACFDYPAIQRGTPASNGPAHDCVVDKTQGFAAELTDPSADLDERVAPRKFVLHFVGDLHQPRHSSDDNDRGGNARRVSALGFKAKNAHFGTANSSISLKRMPRPSRPT
jgi:hypothetical protein